MSDPQEHPLKIGFVDDDLEDQFFFEEAISKLGISYSLKLFNDCQSLLEYIQQKNQCLDVIFLDINLPVMDGKECLRALKNDDTCKHIPVLIFSTSEYERDIDDVYSLGAHRHVVKPYASINFNTTLKIIFDINWKNQQPVPPREQFVIKISY